MRISDWSSDVCSSDLDPDLTSTEQTKQQNPAKIQQKSSKSSKSSKRNPDKQPLKQSQLPNYQHQHHRRRRRRAHLPVDFSPIPPTPRKLLRSAPSPAHTHSPFVCRDNITPHIYPTLHPTTTKPTHNTLQEHTNYQQHTQT